MNKNFAKIIFVVTLFVGTFFIGGSVKALDCCITSEVKFQSNGINYDESTIEDISCRLKPSDSNCFTPKTVTYKMGVKYGVYSTGPFNCADKIICKQTLLGVKCNEEKTEPNCSNYPAACFWSPTYKCISINDVSLCPKLNKEECGRFVKAGCKWEGTDTDGQCKTPLGQTTSEMYRTDDPNRYPLLPSCAIDGSCRSLSNILDTVLRATNLIFKYIGAIAFIFFVIGGFTMILSFGNAEKFKKGQQILVAAVVGLLIVFGAYLIISFVVEALGIGAEFKVLK